MAGRNPKPQHLRIIDGKTHHGSAEENRPQIFVDGELGEAPAWFKPAQRLKWDHLARSAPAGMLTELDRQLVVQYCVSAALYDECAQNLGERGGPVVLSPNKNVPMQSPYLHSLNQASADLHRCTQALGFSPTARTRVKAPIRGKKSSSTFADLKRLELEETKGK
jgi:P27 family predicted phage terminase small subunit